MEYTRGILYNIIMFGITVTEQSFIYSDNQSVLCNTAALTPTLKKHSNTIDFHFVREGCPRDEWRTTHTNIHYNVADLTTKPLAGEKLWEFVHMLQHYICPNISYLDDI